jgi:hypothetical protein
MTNATLRKRFGIQNHNSAKAYRLIAEAVGSKLVKAADATQRKKYASFPDFALSP